MLSMTNFKSVYSFYIRKVVNGNAYNPYLAKPPKTFGLLLFLLFNQFVNLFPQGIVIYALDISFNFLDTVLSSLLFSLTIPSPPRLPVP